MHSIKQIIEDALTWIILPATIFGAGGAIVRASRKGWAWKLIICEAFFGILIANMAYPAITKYAPDEWHYTLYFLTGWGGVEGVGSIYAWVMQWVERHIKRYGINIQQAETWDGLERRVNSRRNGEDGNE